MTDALDYRPLQMQFSICCSSCLAKSDSDPVLACSAASKNWQTRGHVQRNERRCEAKVGGLGSGCLPGKVQGSPLETVSQRLDDQLGHFMIGDAVRT